MSSRVRRATTTLLSLLMLLPLAGCGWLDIFSKEDGNEPMRLERINAQVEIDRLWRVSVGNGQGKKYNVLRPALSGNRVFAAGNNGEVVAVQADNGRVVWRKRTKQVITGGVGASNGLVVVGTENSRVLAFAEDDGRELWSAEVSSEVLAPPATNGRIVVVQTVDGRLTGLDAATGQQRWIYENDVPALSLRGTSAPLILENFVIAAMANGSVVSIATDNGTLRWEQRVAIPTGRSDIERLVDIDGPVWLNEAGQILVTAYQGYLAVIDAVTGQTRWRTEASSWVGNASGFGNAYLADESGNVRAFRIGQDQPVWTNESLLRRRLSTPVGFSNYLAVGDFEGYVHFLSQIDGRIVGRTKVDGDGLRAPMIAQGNTLYAYGNGGSLVALRVR